MIYISSYYVANSGYYEYHLQEKTFLTNEKIKEFESDVKNNQDIDIKNYLVYEEVDYTNGFTNFIYKINSNSNEFARKIIKKIFKKISSLVYE